MRWDIFIFDSWRLHAVRGCNDSSSHLTYFNLGKYFVRSLVLSVTIVSQNVPLNWRYNLYLFVYWFLISMAVFWMAAGVWSYSCCSWRDPHGCLPYQTTLKKKKKYGKLQTQYNLNMPFERHKQRNLTNPSSDEASLLNQFESTWKSLLWIVWRISRQWWNLPLLGKISESVVNFDCKDEILWCEYSNETSSTVLLLSVMWYLVFWKWNFELFLKFHFDHCATSTRDSIITCIFK